MYKEKWKKYLPYGSLFVLFLLLHCGANIMVDDEFFSQVLENNSNFVEWLGMRYDTWSSRLLIEALVVFIADKGIALWCFIEAVIMALIGFCIVKISKIKSLDISWCVIGLILLYPIADMSSAGWIATTGNYMWPLALGLIGYLPLVDFWERGNTSGVKLFFGVIAFVFSCNVEQMCVLNLLLIIWCLFIWIKDRKEGKGYVLILSLINIASLFFILLSPGNEKRNIAEVGTWFPDWNMFNLIDKVELGFSSTMKKLILEPNWVFFFFALILMLAVFEKYSKWEYRVIATIPCAISGILGIGSKLIVLIFPNLTAIYDCVEKNGMINSSNFFETRRYVVLAVMLLVCFCVGASLFILEFGESSYYIGLYICVSGFAVRMIMAFSPTIWASSDRTYCFTYFSLIMVAALVLNKLKEENYIKLIKILLVLVGILCYIGNMYVC